MNLLPAFCFFCINMLPFTSGATGNQLFVYVDKKPAICDSTPHISANYRIITNSDNSYGYDIFVNRKLLIHQPFIPGLPGVKGFPRKGDAKKVAGLVIKKIQHGLMPPTLETRELDSLKIKY